MRIRVFETFEKEELSYSVESESVQMTLTRKKRKLREGLVKKVGCGLGVGWGVRFSPNRPNLIPKSTINLTRVVTCIIKVFAEHLAAVKSHTPNLLKKQKNM